jgi:uroporphyrinogen-III synthase
MTKKRIVVTRSREDAREMIDALEAKGCEAVVFPTIAIRPVEDHTELDRALDRITSYDALVFGSKHAAEIVLDRAAALRVAVTARIACVGAKTKAYVEKRVAGAAIIAPEVFRAEALVEAIDRAFLGVKGKRFLFPRAKEGRETLIDQLAGKGAIVDAPVVYAIGAAPKACEAALGELETADAFTFLSGETLRAFFEIVSEPTARRLLDRAVVAVIGPVAAEKAIALGVRVDVVPEKATAESLIEALLRRLSSE